MRARKQPRSIYLFLSFACQDLVTRKDFENGSNTKTFRASEVAERIERVGNAYQVIEEKNATELKYLVLALREQFRKNAESVAFAADWRCWMNEAKRLERFLSEEAFAK